MYAYQTAANPRTTPAITATMLLRKTLVTVGFDMTVTPPLGVDDQNRVVALANIALFSQSRQSRTT